MAVTAGVGAIPFFIICQNAQAVLHVVSHLESHERAVVIPISHLGKLRPEKLSKLSQGHSSTRLRV